MNKKFHARLHVVLAREAAVGVVFRRGPSLQVCSILWDRKNDTFKVGQWLKGRIYERRTDLSPDGKFLIYFARDEKAQESWTAISRSPWLKAIELYDKGDCWEGGGLFLDNKNYWLNDTYFTPLKILRQSTDVQRNDEYIPEGDFGAEDTGVYYRRLIRDGWTLTGHDETNKEHSSVVFEKPLSQNLVLRKVAHEQVNPPKGKGCYWDEYYLVTDESDEEIKNDWEWAETDESSVVWAAKGCIFRAAIASGKKLGAPKLLCDFNLFEFEKIIAPY